MAIYAEKIAAETGLDAAAVAALMESLGAETKPFPEGLAQQYKAAGKPVPKTLLVVTNAGAYKRWKRENGF